MCLGSELDIELWGCRRVPEGRIQLQGLGAGAANEATPVCLEEIRVVIDIEHPGVT